VDRSVKRKERWKENRRGKGRRIKFRMGTSKRRSKMEGKSRKQRAIERKKGEKGKKEKEGRREIWTR